jgi:hypothetical protein
MTMRDSALRADQHSFVVRIWCEAAGNRGDATTWRGSVDHVGSGDRLYFDEPEAIVRFVREQTGLRARPRHWWAAILSWIRREDA